MSVKYAAAEEGVKSVKLMVPVSAEAPVFVNTTTTVPSAFLKAPVPTPEIVPEVVRRYAYGLMKRDHIANAHSLPDGLIIRPVGSALTRWSDEPDPALEESEVSNGD